MDSWSSKLDLLKRLYRDLAPDESLRGLLDGMTEMSFPGNLMFDPGTKGAKPRLNRDHPTVQKLLSHQDSDIGCLYLLSSIFSIYNRARVEIDDAMERRFHARVLEYLVLRSMNGSAAGRDDNGGASENRLP